MHKGDLIFFIGRQNKLHTFDYKFSVEVHVDNRQQSSTVVTFSSIMRYRL